MARVRKEIKASTCPEIRALLQSRRAEIANACGVSLDPDGVIETAVICFYEQHKLLECTHSSIVAAVMQVCVVGLDLNKKWGEAYLIPRWDKVEEVYKCHWEVGYQGLCQLARESGKVNYIHARTVHAHDDFEWRWNPELEYVHGLSRDGRLGHPTHVYCVARLTTGELQGECLTVEQVEQYRARSQRPNDGPWVTDWEPMAEKTAAIQLCNWLPRTRKLAMAMKTLEPITDDGGEIPDEPELGQAPTVPIQTVAVPPTAQIPPSSSPTATPEPPKKAERLTAMLAARAAALQGIKPAAAVVLAPSPLWGEGRGEGVPAPRPPARPAAPAPPVEVDPKTGQELADYAKLHNLTFFASYGRSRKFPIPMISWGTDHVRRAWEGYIYERDVLKTFGPVPSAR